MTAAQSIRQFKAVTDALGIEVSELGCVMLPVSSFDVFDGREGLLDQADLYTSTNPEHWWVDGAVAAKGGHVTLLYGLLQRAWQIEDQVRAVLADWEPPAQLSVSHVEVFDSPDPDEPYGCVVARLDVTRELADAHARLSFLPHVDTFPEYKPHVTLAYVKRRKAHDWADLLNLDTLTFDVIPELDLGKRS
ncbi:2'-5' RNA ligase family protein [Gryllotalpicola koreensis]|uniref:2'-5' RNA ligase family protein n=1 Tax=Gryllotalpicola koreensis TaxID=993086 RepID=A0ABP8A2T7_9MICO